VEPEIVLLIFDLSTQVITPPNLPLSTPLNSCPSFKRHKTERFCSSATISDVDWLQNNMNIYICKTARPQSTA